VKFLGFSPLDGASLFEIVVILISGISVGIYQGFDCDNGPRTTQLIFVFDGDVRFFGHTLYLAGFVAFAVPAARS